MPKNWFKIVNKVANEVTIEIDGEIGGESWWNETTSADKVKRDLKDLSDSLNGDISQINVEIFNSPGGSLDHAFAIYDMLTEHKAAVKTHAIGKVASAAASVILQAGDKGKRELSQNALFLVHRAWSFEMGTADEMEAMAKDIRTFESRIIAINKESTGLSENKILEHMNNNNGKGEWWNAEKAIQEGYADTIVKSNRVAASTLTPEIMAKYKLPEIINQNLNTMSKFKMSALPFLAKLFGFKPEDQEEKEVTPEMLTIAENKAVEQDQKITTLEAEKASAITDKEKAENDLKAEKEAKTAIENKLKEVENKVAEQATQIEALKAGETKTEPKEDPNITDTAKSNMSAADKDAEALKA